MKTILGIDVGGTKIAAGLVDSSLKIRKIKQVPTSQDDLAGQLVGLIASFGPVDGIGVGMPGQVLGDGTVVKLPNVKKFGRRNVKKLLTSKFKVPVHVMNDAKAFALAEAVAGAGKGKKTVAGIILGTGIGVGIIMDGQVYYGKDGLAGEVEHITMIDGRMLRYYRKSAGSFYHLSHAKRHITTILSTVVLTINPDMIVLGGGWSKLKGMEKFANQVTKNAGGYQTVTPVKISRLPYPGVIGAALPLLRR